MVDLRTNSEQIIRELKRGERLMLSYRGEPLAELVPPRPATPKLSPPESLARAQALTARDPSLAARTSRYLQELRTDQQKWSERSPSQ